MTIRDLLVHIDQTQAAQVRLDEVDPVSETEGVAG